MKKLLSILTISILLSITIFSIKIYADTLDTIDITLDKETVHPNETITVNINFGTNLGSYTANIAYDNNLLEYVSSEGVTSYNDQGTKIIAYFVDDQGGQNPSDKMSITFKAKNVTTSNPTDLSITFNGLADPDATAFDDIEIPITKSIMVEPIYTDYEIALNYTGDIIKNEEKDMKLIISSSMGKSYEHTRIIAEATTPENGTVKLLATDSQSLEHDIIQNGWGSAEGDSIGGVDIAKELNVRGIFSEVGNYSIKLSLIDRDNSDNEIVSKTFSIEVKEEAQTTGPNNDTENNPEETTGNENEETTGNENTEIEKTDEEKTPVQINTKTSEEPNNLPKTGNTIYIIALSIVAVLVLTYFCIKKRK